MPTVTRPLHVFLCYAKEDKPIVHDLFKQLRIENWLDVWLDDIKLVPGAEWELEIEKAVEQADVVLVCLSNLAVKKEGYIQKEIRTILKNADKKPEGTIFVLPVRLDECEVPHSLSRFQYIDYFPLMKQLITYKRILDSMELRANKLGLTSSCSSPSQDHPVVQVPAREDVGAQSALESSRSTRSPEEQSRFGTVDAAMIPKDKIRPIDQEEQERRRIIRIREADARIKQEAQERKEAAIREQEEYQRRRAEASAKRYIRTQEQKAARERTYQSALEQQKIEEAARERIYRAALERQKREESARQKFLITRLSGIVLLLVTCGVLFSPELQAVFAAISMKPTPTSTQPFLEIRTQAGGATQEEECWSFLGICAKLKSGQWNIASHIRPDAQSGPGKLSLPLFSGRQIYIKGKYRAGIGSEDLWFLMQTKDECAWFHESQLEIKTSDLSSILEVDPNICVIAVRKSTPTP